MKTSRTILTEALVHIGACEIMPRNTLSNCSKQCKDSKKSKACYDGCDCIHNHGQPLDTCFDKHNKASADIIH